MGTRNQRRKTNVNYLILYLTSEDVYAYSKLIVILLPKAPSKVLAATQYLMRWPCLAVVVDMNFQGDSSMVNGKLSWVHHESIYTSHTVCVQPWLCCVGDWKHCEELPWIRSLHHV